MKGLYHRCGAGIGSLGIRRRRHRHSHMPDYTVAGVQRLGPRGSEVRVWYMGVQGGCTCGSLEGVTALTVSPTVCWDPGEPAARYCPGPLAETPGLRLPTAGNPGRRESGSAGLVGGERGRGRGRGVEAWTGEGGRKSVAVSGAAWEGGDGGRIKESGLMGQRLCLV